MQKRASLFVLVVMLLGVTVACVYSATQAQEGNPKDSEVVYQEVNLTPPPDPAAMKDGSSREPIDPEALKEMQRRALEAAKNSVEIPASGPTTMGATLEIAGKSIKLPDDVYIHSTVLAMDCLAGAECPEAPLYMLRYKDSDLIVGVSIRSGQIHNPGMDERQNADSRNAFQWLTDALAQGESK